MKKIVLVVLTTLLATALLFGCAAPTATPAPTMTPAPTATPTPVPPTPSYLIDFEDSALFGFATVCFNEALTKTNLAFEANAGLTGKALKGIIQEPEAGNTWWTIGLAMDVAKSDAMMFKGLKTVSFDYISTVEFKNTPFMLQLVWKDKTTKEVVATLDVNFPMEETAEKMTFVIDVPADVRDLLTAADDYYLDWAMIGLKDKAGDDFRPGTMFMDNLSFYNDPSYVAPEGTGPKPVFSIDFEKPEIFGFTTVCFNEALTKTNLAFEPATGFKGNAMKGLIAEPEAGNTWWTIGLGVSKDASDQTMFKDMTSFRFTYTSDVEFKNVPFIVQLVWKDKATGAEFAKVQVDFPVEKTAEPKTFKAVIPEDVAKKITESTDCYLDWIMIGLADKAGDDFKPGTIRIDDLSFFGK